jgi:hypothetical protein
MTLRLLEDVRIPCGGFNFFRSGFRYFDSPGENRADASPSFHSFGGELNQPAFAGSSSRVSDPRIPKTLSFELTARTSRNLALALQSAGY